MAETRGEGAAIFRKSALSRINSADELDRYIKVTSPSVWVILAGIIALVIGFVIWSATAVIPTNVNLTGIGGTDGVVVWIDEATYNQIKAIPKENIVAEINGAPTKIKDINPVPLSSAEVLSLLDSDYLQKELQLAQWNYEVVLEKPAELSSVEASVGKTSNETEVHFYPVKITVSQTHPIAFLAN